MRYECRVNFFQKIFFSGFKILALMVANRLRGAPSTGSPTRKFTPGLSSLSKISSTQRFGSFPPTFYFKFAREHQSMLRVVPRSWSWSLIDITQEGVGLVDQFSIRDLEEKGKKFCGTKWDELLAVHSAVGMLGFES